MKIKKIQKSTNRQTGKPANRLTNNGQIIIEYAVMFAILVAVIIYAALTHIRPAMNGFFEGAANVINTSTQRIERGM